jgi:hypothetical protein
VTLTISGLIGAYVTVVLRLSLSMLPGILMFDISFHAVIVPLNYANHPTKREPRRLFVGTIIAVLYAW